MPTARMDRATAPIAYWSLPPGQLLAAIGSTPDGLRAAEAAQRLVQYGPNLLQAHTHATALRAFLGQFTSPIMLILLFATLVSAALGDWIDAAIILAIVFGSATLSFTQEYRANTAAEKLRAQVRIQATVLRDGQPRTIPVEEVVAGDVVLLSAGSRVPADGVVLEAKDLYVNQAVLTGETFPAEKQATPVAAGASLAERTNGVFLGTSVRSGSARALVVQTGTATAFGQIADRLTLRPPETDFERGIRRLGYLLSEVTLLLVLTVFAVNVFFQKPVIDSLLFSLALAVGLTPQLLPAIINVNLSRGAQAMAKAGVIVRRLSSIENFGAMDVLCTDKTGTLTMGVVQLDGALDAAGNPSEAVLRAAYLNAHFQTGMANPLDEAIVAQPVTAIGGVTKLDEIPYDFTRKRLSVVVQEGGRRTLIAKGALDSILAVCTQMQDGTEVMPLDAARQADIQRRFVGWSEQGYRVLGVAVADVPEQPAYTRDDEHDLMFLGFLLFLDPPKPGMNETIGQLASMGVQLKIITGDNRL
ncbi:MAG TPA: HAD-IC family P-type ATPase, partial [Roseiflexaceae bacterium]